MKKKPPKKQETYSDPTVEGEQVVDSVPNDLGVVMGGFCTGDPGFLESLPVVGHS